MNFDSGMINKMAQQLTAQVAALKAEGTAGGGAIKMVVTGSGGLESVTISPEAVDPNDVALLEQLIVAAFNDANKKLAALKQEKFGPLLGGMGLPGM